MNILRLHSASVDERVVSGKDTAFLGSKRDLKVITKNLIAVLTTTSYQLECTKVRSLILRKQVNLGIQVI